METVRIGPFVPFGSFCDCALRKYLYFSFHFILCLYINIVIDINLIIFLLYSHLPVDGTYVWCQGCGHGGHLKHMLRWFKDASVGVGGSDGPIECPSGCGHHCQLKITRHASGFAPAKH